eukprot:TRINITY_DN14627_c0_g1_i1.p2 TRINITY_DN14627_c0_g1~~TRINITY_DN14627_c0_g1_i1.p2  ORF type:complete len:121 (-),score=21.92 TRINITY_DN14627_c0_g1_i1:350-712(-)
MRIVEGRKDMLRGICVLPYEYGGKPPRIAVFSDEAGAEIARAEGVEVIGNKDLADSILDGGPIDFDWCIATQAGMSLLKPLGRVLGPKGLIPTAKLQNLVTIDKLKAAIEQARKYLVDFR